MNPRKIVQKNVQLLGGRTVGPLFGLALLALLGAAVLLPPPPDVHAQSENSYQTALVGVYPRGFWPRRLEVRPGRLLLLVEDRTGLDEVNLSVEGAHGNPLAGARVPRRIAPWHSIVEVSPGVYRLLERDHPEWSCEIEVRP